MLGRRAHELTARPTLERIKPGVARRRPRRVRDVCTLPSIAVGLTATGGARSAPEPVWRGLRCPDAFGCRRVLGPLPARTPTSAVILTCATVTPASNCKENVVQTEQECKIIIRLVWSRIVKASNLAGEFGELSPQATPAMPWRTPRRSTRRFQRPRNPAGNTGSPCVPLQRGP